MNNERFIIVVPCTPRKVGRRWIDAVTYPCTGFPRYTKVEAIKQLEKFAARGMDAWAESETSRFALDTL